MHAVPPSVRRSSAGRLRRLGALVWVAGALLVLACDDDSPSPADSGATADAASVADALVDSGSTQDRDDADGSLPADSGGAIDVGPQKDGGPAFDAGSTDVGFFGDADQIADVKKDRDAGPGNQDAASASTDAGPADAGVGAAMGPWVAFNSKRFGNQWDLFVVRPDGSDVTRITVDGARDLHPSWSPDGRKLAFASRRGTDPGIFIADIQTSSITTLITSLSSESSPSWSPNGRLVVFEARPDPNADHDVYAIAVAGGAPMRLTNATGKDAGPVWAPDGSKIYFVSDRMGGFDVWSMDPDGSNQTRVTTNSGILGKPTVAPDGRSIAYTRLVPGTQTAEIVRYALASGTITSLTAMDDSEPSFSPDGQTLVCTSFRFGNAEVVSIQLAGGAVTRLTDHPSLDTAPAFGP